MKKIVQHIVVFLFTLVYITISIGSVLMEHYCSASNNREYGLYEVEKCCNTSCEVGEPISADYNLKKTPCCADFAHYIVFAAEFFSPDNLKIEISDISLAQPLLAVQQAHINTALYNPFLSFYPTSFLHQSSVFQRVCCLRL